MERLFISGSRSANVLTTLLCETLDNMMSYSPTILIGDANGADAMVQSYLADEGYKDVIVCHVGDKPRNNFGKWPTERVATGAARGTREFYTAKDVAMAEVATVGLALWDGKSRGTLRNMIHLDGQGKPCAVYLTRPDSIEIVENPGDLQKIIRAWSR